jgi:hypothetical protein
VLVVSEVCAGNTMLEGLEQSTLEAKKGLWVVPQPVPPWKWSHRGK